MTDVTFIKLNYYGGKKKYLEYVKKNGLPATKIRLFVLKILPFLRLDDKIEVFDKLEELFLNSENKYTKIIALLVK